LIATGVKLVSDEAYWLAKTSGGWTVQNHHQIFAVHPTRNAALAHLDRLMQSEPAQVLDAPESALPDMPRSDSFFRRFS